MTPEELISTIRHRHKADWSQSRYDAGSRVVLELATDGTELADSIGLLLERCDRLERLVRDFRARERDERDEQRNVLEGFHWEAEDRRRFLADWEAETERMLNGGE